MGELTIHFKSGATYRRDNTTCFSLLNNRRALAYALSTRNIHITDEAVESITYNPEVSTVIDNKDMRTYITDYFTLLKNQTAIKKYIIVGKTSEDLQDEGINLPASLSGPAIMGIFSLFRYAVEYPTMIATAVEFSQKLPFDKALYLSHFTEYKVEEFTAMCRYSQGVIYGSRPRNHSIISPDTMYKGGYKFLNTALPIIAELPAYEKTLGYGNIQGLFSVYNENPIRCKRVTDSLDDISSMGDIM